MSKDIRDMINKIKKVKKNLNENVSDVTSIREYLYKYFDLDNVIEPASLPIKDGNVRLYHQTSLENFEKIKKDGRITLKTSKGASFGEPTIIWGAIVKNEDDGGFYGSPKEIPTIEYQIPHDEVDKGTGGVRRDVTSDEIIAYHDPRLFNIKNIINRDDYLNKLISDPDKWINFGRNTDFNTNTYAYYLIADAIKKLK
jgi:hypothetical protein